jgi:hypothetical protein
MQHSSGSAAVPTTLAENIIYKIFFLIALLLLLVRLATYLRCIPTMAALRLCNGEIGNVTCQQRQKKLIGHRLLKKEVEQFSTSFRI